ncbi:GntR family transcriptional regulator [Bifidobacterium santillanense]|nr:GntR family transcriptional regulator [Bifidobacterium santillanense]
MNTTAGIGPAHGTGPNGGDLRIVIRESSPMPVREQIRSQIEGLVRIGALTAGDRLPSVRQLAGDLRVAPGTVAKAYAELAEQGVIDTGLGRAARVRSVDSVPQELLDAVRVYAAEAKRRGVSLDDAISALRAQWR